MNVLLSIKPKYADAILRGEKQYEFRKVIFKDKHVEHVYIYSSSPVKKIVGVFQVGDIMEGHPQHLWNQCQEKSGIDQDAFFKYFNGTTKGYAIKIEKPQTLETPIDPRTHTTNFTPPQSFCYYNTPPNGGPPHG